MELFNALDRLANGGTRSRMPEDLLAAYKESSQEANHFNVLAHLANGHGGSRADQRKAEATLFRELGSRKARKLIEQASRQASGGGS
ncbi:hypothetical protein ABZW49_10120 [Nonomuraea wenchangensis]